MKVSSILAIITNYFLDLISEDAICRTEAFFDIMFRISGKMNSQDLRLTVLKLFEIVAVIIPTVSWLS